MQIKRAACESTVEVNNGIMYRALWRRGIPVHTMFSAIYPKWTPLCRGYPIWTPLCKPYPIWILYYIIYPIWIPVKVQYGTGNLNQRILYAVKEAEPAPRAGKKMGKRKKTLPLSICDALRDDSRSKIDLE